MLLCCRTLMNLLCARCILGGALVVSQEVGFFLKLLCDQPGTRTHTTRGRKGGRADT